MEHTTALFETERTERDPKIVPILQKALDGERLSFAEIVTLLNLSLIHI